MSDFIIYPKTLNTGEVTVTTGGSLSGFPKDNLEDKNWGTVWKNDTAAEIVTLDFDLGSDNDVDYLTLGLHNITTSNIGIKFAWDTNNNGAYSGLTYLVGSAGAFHAFEDANAVIWIENFTQVTKRYFRFIVENVASFTPEFHIIGMGEKISPMPNYNNDADLGYNYGSEKFQTDGGQIKANKNHKQKREWQIQFENFDETDKIAYDTLLAEIDGGKNPFFISDLDGENHYVRLMQNNLSPIQNEHELYSNNLTLLEESYFYEDIWK